MSAMVVETTDAALAWACRLLRGGRPRAARPFARACDLRDAAGRAAACLGCEACLSGPSPADEFPDVFARAEDGEGYAGYVLVSRDYLRVLGLFARVPDEARSALFGRGRLPGARSLGRGREGPR